jgi:hypothetical protein
MKRTILFLLAVTTAVSCLFAQTTKNPFSELGYKKQVMYTSSKGEFEEFHDKADVVEIGSIYFNSKTKKVVGYLNEEKEKTEVATATSAMSVDPMCEKYYWISPYAYCLNNPVRFVDPDGKVVRFAPGVSAQFKKDYMAAGHALKTHGSGSFMRTLEKSKTVYTIAESNSLYSKFDGKTNTITWASNAMMLTTNGTSISPTTILNHELDHAAQKDQNPGQQKIDANTKSTDYKNKEEERVITGSEQQTAKNLGEIKEGEVTRTDHGGTLYKTDSPTSTEITNQATVTAPKKEEKK